MSLPTSLSTTLINSYVSTKFYIANFVSANIIKYYIASYVFVIVFNVILASYVFAIIIKYHFASCLFIIYTRVISIIDSSK